MSLNDWKRQLISRYADNIRKYMHEVQGKEYDDIEMKDLESEVNRFFTTQSLFRILNHVIYGWLLPSLNRIDKIRY